MVRSRAPAARTRQSRRSGARRVAIATSTCRGRRRTRTAIRSSNTRSRCGSNPGVWVPVGTSTTYRWSNLANGVAQEFRVRSRNRDPDWSPCQRLLDPGRPVRGSAAAGRTRPPSAPTARPSSPTRIRATRAATITGVQVRANGGATQAAGGSPHTFTGLANGTGYSFDVRAQNEVGWGPWSPASNGVVPAGPPIGPGIHQCQPVRRGWGRSQLARRQRQRQPAHAVPDLRQWFGRGRRAGDVDASGRPRRQHRRTRSRSGHVTTSGAAHGRRPARRRPTDRPTIRTHPTSTSAPGPPWKPVGVPRTAMASGSTISMPTSIRAATRQVNGNSTSWNATPGTGYRVRVRACNAAGCAAWSPWSQTLTILIAGPEVTASYHGDAQGQSGCSSSRCTYVRVVATGLNGEHRLHGDVPVDRQSGRVQRFDRADQLQRHARR